MNKTLKRIGSILLAATSLASICSITACDEPDGPQSGQTVITMMGWGDTDERRIFGTMIDNFMQENPEYYVSYNATDGDSYMNNLTNLFTNRKNMPDVFYMADTEFVQYAYSLDGIFEDLNPYVNASQNLDKNDLYEESIRAYSFNKETQTLGDPAGALYGLPKDLGPTVLVYNKEYAQTAGITVDNTISVGYDVENKKLNDKVPMTWAQYIKFAEDLSAGGKQKTNKKTVYGSGNYPIELAYYSTGNSFINYDMEENKTNATVNNADFAMALQFCADLETQFKVVVPQEAQKSTSGIQRFVQGDAAMVFAGTWQNNALWKCTYDWDILPTPVPSETNSVTDANGNVDYNAAAREGTKNVSYLGSVCLSVFAGSKVKEGAYKLVEYLSTSKSAQEYNYKAGMSVPNLKSQMADFKTATLNDPRKMNRPLNRTIYEEALANSHRRELAYTWNGEYDNDWSQALYNCPIQNYKYHIYHVYQNKDTTGRASSYAPNYIIYDWKNACVTTQAMSYGGETGAISGIDFLAGLNGEMQRRLNVYNGQYKFYSAY